MGKLSKMNEREKAVFEAYFKKTLGYSLEKAIDLGFKVYERMGSVNATQEDHVVAVVKTELEANLLRSVLQDTFVSIGVYSKKEFATWRAWFFGTYDKFTVFLRFEDVRTFGVFENNDVVLTETEKKAMERIAGVTFEELREDIEDSLANHVVNQKSSHIVWRSMKRAKFYAYRRMVQHMFKAITIYFDGQYRCSSSTSSSFSLLNTAEAGTNEQSELVEVYLGF